MLQASFHFFSLCLHQCLTALAQPPAACHLGPGLAAGLAWQRMDRVDRTDCLALDPGWLFPPKLWTAAFSWRDAVLMLSWRPGSCATWRGGGCGEEGKQIGAAKPLLVAVATFRNDWRSIAAAWILFAFIFSSGTASRLKIKMAETNCWASYCHCDGSWVWKVQSRGERNRGLVGFKGGRWGSENEPCVWWRGAGW